jgi:hypothetical protein
MKNKRSPSAEAMSKKLLASGYEHLSEKDPWRIKKGGKCEPYCQLSAFLSPVS